MKRLILSVLLAALIIPKELISSFKPNDVQYERSYQCLYLAIWEESRGESIEAKEAVAIAIKNRVLSGEYPDNYCKVISQKVSGVKQFSWYKGIYVPVPKNTIEEEALLEAKDVAMKSLNGVISWSHNGLHFRSTKSKISGTTMAWFRKLTKVSQYGNLIFYK